MPVSSATLYAFIAKNVIAIESEASDFLMYHRRIDESGLHLRNAICIVTYTSLLTTSTPWRRLGR